MSKHQSEGPNPGEIGYRTRPYHTGLDPLDNQYELARVEGYFIRKLLTGKLYFRKPFYIILLGAIGLLFIAIPPLSFIANNSTAPDAGTLTTTFVCATLLLWVIGFLCLYNAVTSIRHLRRLSDDHKTHDERQD